MFTTWLTRTNLTLLWSRMNRILILENGKGHLSFFTNPIVKKSKADTKVKKPYDRNDTRKIKNEWFKQLVYLLVLSWIKCYIISNKCLFIYVDFRCLANHMQMLLGKKMVIGHYGYWHFLSTASTVTNQIRRYKQISLEWKFDDHLLYVKNDYIVKPLSWITLKHWSSSTNYYIFINLRYSSISNCFWIFASRCCHGDNGESTDRIIIVWRGI